MNKWGIKIQALILALVPAIIIAISLVSYFLYSQINMVNDTLNERGVNTAKHLAYESQYGIFSGNILSLKRHTDERVLEHDIRSIIILDNEKNTLINSGDKENADFILEDLNDINNKIQIPSNNSIVYVSSISSPQLDVTEFEEINNEIQQIIGWALVEISLDSTDKQINSVLFNTLIITLFISLIATMMAIKISRNVTQPILSLSKVVDKIGDGNLDVRAKAQSAGELHILESGINKMAEDLQALQENMQSKIDVATSDLKDTLELLQSKNTELEHARKDASEANKIKSEFLANMSHEIRTPINGIIGFTTLMLKSPSDPTQKSHLEMIKESSFNLLKIVDDILDMTRIEAGKLNISIEPLNLRDCVEQVMKMMAPAAFDKCLDLTLLYYSDVPEEFYGDSLRINQIITNLLANAIKFTKNGSITIRVMIEDEKDERSLVAFSITDTGEGIPEEQQEHLFKPFIQGDSSTTKNYGGSGLGLSICNSLIEKMGGALGFESHINEGTTFWFNLPLTKNTNKKPNPAPATLKGKNIILCEPDPTNRLSIQHLLTHAGMSVNECDPTGNTPSNIEHKKNGHNDIVIISDSLAHLESLTNEFFDGVHKKTGAKILVIAPTINNNIIDSLTDKGADICISKPVFRDSLYRTLVELTETSPKTKPLKQEKMEGSCHLNILVAEDNEINARLVATILEQHGTKATIASDGEMVLKQLSHKSFDLILMDIHMPVLDGVNTTRAIRENCALYPCEIPIIAVTANVLGKDRQRFLDAGMNDLIVKPITEKSIWEIINKWVEHSCFMGEFLSDDITRLIPADLYEQVKIEVSEHTQKIMTALEQNDMDTLFTHTHKLNGLAAYFNITAIREVVNKLETSIKQNKDNSVLKSQIDHLHAEVEKLNS